MKIKQVNLYESALCHHNRQLFFSHLHHDMSLLSVVDPKNQNYFMPSHFQVRGQNVKVTQMIPLQWRKRKFMVRTESLSEDQHQHSCHS